MSTEVKFISDIEEQGFETTPYIYKDPLGFLIVRRPKYRDERGSFQEIVRLPDIEKILEREIFIRQSQISESRPGVLRGIHAENQVKIITPISGSYLQLFVDLRPGSQTLGKHRSFFVDTLSTESKITFVVPEGFGNAIYVYESAVVPLIYHYATTATYDPSQAGRGVRYDDPTLNINWPVRDPIISERDRAMPSLQEFLQKYS